jgi:hypothetical protein
MPVIKVNIIKDKYSLMGDFEFSFQSFGLKDFIKDCKIDQSSMN